MAVGDEDRIVLLNDEARQRRARLVFVAWLVLWVTVTVAFVLLVPRPLPWPWSLVFFLGSFLLVPIALFTLSPPFTAALTLGVPVDRAVDAVRAVAQRHGRRQPTVANDGVATVARWSTFEDLEPRSLRIVLTPGERGTGLVVQLRVFGGLGWAGRNARRWLERFVEELRFEAT